MFSHEFILETEKVRLRPLKAEDIDSLLKVSGDLTLWNYFPTVLATKEAMSHWIQQALEEKSKLQRIPFCIIEKSNGKAIGSTSYMNISQNDLRLEIGSTWLATEVHGSGINKDCKFLLLQYAFEELGYERVELKTDVLNTRSRKAILKLGAIEEGTLRSHMIMPGNRRRDTIFYSILQHEWPKIKETVFVEFN